MAFTGYKKKTNPTKTGRTQSISLWPLGLCGKQKIKMVNHQLAQRY